MFLQPTRTSHSRTGSPWRATSAAGVCRAAQCSVGGGRRPNNPTVLRSRSTPMSQRAVVVGYGTQIEGQNVLQVKEGPSFVRCAGGGPGPSAMSSEQYPPSRPRSLHRAGRPTRRAYPRSDARTDARGPLLRPDQCTQVCLPIESRWALASYPYALALSHSPVPPLSLCGEHEPGGRRQCIGIGSSSPRSAVLRAHPSRLPGWQHLRGARGTTGADGRAVAAARGTDRVTGVDGC